MVIVVVGCDFYGICRCMKSDERYVMMMRMMIAVILVILANCSIVSNHLFESVMNS